jgi:hypothetical protein
MWRTVVDHFEPDEATDPKAQREVRRHLEQIDYTAYAANKTVMGAALGGVDVRKFEHLAIATAKCRARWVAAALAWSESGQSPSKTQVDELAHLRAAYEELTQVYDAMRRMVERGYLSYA